MNAVAEQRARSEQSIALIDMSIRLRPGKQGPYQCDLRKVLAQMLTDIGVRIVFGQCAGRLKLSIRRSDREAQRYRVMLASSSVPFLEDLKIDFVKMLGRARLRPTPAQVGRDQGAEMVHPSPNCLVGDQDAAFCHQIFHVPETEGEPKTQPDGLMDDLGRAAIPAVADFRHPFG